MSSSCLSLGRSGNRFRSCKPSFAASGKQRRGTSKKAQAHQLGQDDRAEYAVSNEIAAPQAPRLLFDAVEPFETEPLPGQGSATNLSREHVERATDAMTHWDAELIT